MDAFVRSWSVKVFQMPDFDSSDRFGGQNRQEDPVDENLAPGEDLIMEQILENISSTPIGQVLEKIASLPEVRVKKVLNVRRQLTEGKYNLNERLDVALDKVLDDLIT
ncbi:unnamed protein product [marine sediment metagenome]|uniref:Anti-sigma-28 factor FlgM C-terminal domain-containing protein n=1 Tax=marine sediment metagenome TaxID=412755 RepID=X1JZT6_9ZZZZ